MVADNPAQLPARRRCWCFVACLTVAIAAPAGAENFPVDVRGAWTYDSNVSNAEVESLRESDSIFEFDAAVSYRHQLSDNSGLVAKAGIETDAHANFSDLNSVTGLASLAYVLQPWRSFSGPWFAVSTDFRLRRHEDSDIRDGTIATLAFSAGQQVTDRISAQVRYEFLDRDADEARAFELSNRTLSLVADYRVSNRFTTYAKYDYMDGDVVTTSPPNRKFRPVFRASAPDPAFGPGRIAWRLDGKAHTFRLGSKYRLAEHTALDIGASFSHVNAVNDNEWDTWRVGVGLLHRFK